MNIAGKEMRARAGTMVRAVACLVLFGVAGCEDAVGIYPEKAGKNEPPVFRAPGEEVKRESIFGGEGLVFGGASKKDAEGGAGIGVNSLLWRAALDTIAFMPLASGDPFGGVIITDWYSPPESPGERFKVNIYILSRALRADGLRVSAFRQVRGGSGDWMDAPIDIAGELEDAILTRARQLRMTQTEK
ncbi:MAG: DUF3576 domain-containing protein [Alphaproteobacteria bacterium]|nr:DUF3576 domain-containing protein [Alphaproteobacteria bacterium]MBF0128787.1 DUF3576 domain-containing protein [Alphaproteobacteria bacterium]